MKDKFLSSSILILACALGAAVILPTRSISALMQMCGQFISDMLGF